MDRKESGEGKMISDFGGRTSIAEGTRGSEGPAIRLSEATWRVEARIGGNL